jgi:undecaprenyl diphosphate synthase|tara:strand:- start:3049 stop:3774 length:726 start_codon:yes stop_codon:yes gene_type:complete
MADSQNNNKYYPKNIGIIMDGNGRWAIRNSLKISEGHKKGVGVVRDIVEEAVKRGIQSLTLYAFSSENWQRPKREINAIKRLVIEAINEQVPELKEKKVKLKFFGHLDDFGEKIQNKIFFAENETCFEEAKLNLNVALGYGGQQDIVDIVHKVSEEVSSGNLNSKDISKETINSYSSVPVDEIDLLIRTGGDKRISNFLLYQIAYAEIMFIDKFWPDFTNNDFVNCLDNFKNVSRRFGKRI